MLHHRKRKVRATEDVGAAFSSTSIFITPMLDMSFQLLAFFVFTYQPSMPEGQFPIALAAGEAAGEQRPERPDQPAAPDVPALRPLVIVQARADGRGDLARLDVIFAGRQERIGFEAQEGVAAERLLAGLRRKLLDIRKEYPKDDNDPRSLSLLLQASDGLQWEQSVQVMDACRRAVDETGAAVVLFPMLELDFLR